MPTPQQALYGDNGPSDRLGNTDPDKVLGTYQGGNHEAALLWGNDNHREAYVAKYGYERASRLLKSAIDSHTGSKEPGTKEGDWYNDAVEYYKDLLSRQQM